MISTPERIVSRPSTPGYGMAIPVSLGPCLKYYSIIYQQKGLREFFLPIICRYIQEFKIPRSCELCERSHFALTAHHLIPRSVQRKALEQRWHKTEELRKIAWLCRGCHDHLHRIATPTELGKDYWSIELLLRRTEIWLFVKTVGRLDLGHGDCTGNKLKG